MRKNSTAHYLDITWEDDQLEIMCDVVRDQDMDIVNQLSQNDEQYFRRLDKRSGFVDEVTKLSSKMALFRAFWIINLVYLNYYRKPKYKNVRVFYKVRKNSYAK